MDIHVLGCSGGIGHGLRTTSLRVGTDTLLDCGTGVGDLPLEDLFKIRHIFITHSHLDHIAGLPLLLDTIYEQLLQTPLSVYCQPQTYDALMEHIFNWKIWPNFFDLPSKDRPIVRHVPVLPGESITLADTTYTMVEVEHTVPAVAYIVSDQNTGFAFSGDTASAPKLWDALNKMTNIDLLIVECAFADERAELANQAKHFSPQLLADALEHLKNNPQICISHLQPGVENKILQELQAAMPGRQLRSISSGDLLSL